MHMAQDSADLDRFYGNLRNYVKMVTGGYSNLLMLDARGGLGKTHNVRETLSEEVHDDHWLHQNGYTTPIELYKTLWKARHETAVLFLDDMSGVTRSTKAIDMLKAATDTQGDENVVEYRTSQDIDHPYIEGETLPNTFTFRGSIIMSFNDTPDNRHFDALCDRGTYYNFTLSYQERLDLIDEIAKLSDFSDLSVEEQIETAEWVRMATDPSFEVTVRTFEEVCQMRTFGNETGADWEKMALEVFDMDYEEHLILKMRESMEMTVDEQIERFIEETGTSRSHYYDVWDNVRDKRES
jgi:hypothetical protein